MKVSDYVQDSEFLKAQHLVDWNVPSAIVTIEKIDYETFNATADRAAESKFILTFEEVDNRFPLNKTNLRFLVSQFGDETELWLGKKIVLNVVDTQNQQGAAVKGIRVTAIPQEATLPKKAPAQAAPQSAREMPAPTLSVVDERDPFAEDAPAPAALGKQTIGAMTR